MFLFLWEIVFSFFKGSRGEAAGEAQEDGGGAGAHEAGHQGEGRVFIVV